MALKFEPGDKVYYRTRDGEQQCGLLMVAQVEQIVDGVDALKVWGRGASGAPHDWIFVPVESIHGRVAWDDPRADTRDCKETLAAFKTWYAAEAPGRPLD